MCLHHQSASVVPQVPSAHNLVQVRVQSVPSVPPAHSLNPQVAHYVLQAHSLQVHLPLSVASVQLDRTVIVEHRSVSSVSKALTAYHQVPSAPHVL
jgi:hypothetical protein